MHLNLLLERQSVCRYNGKNFRKHFKIVHMIDFKDGNFCRHTFSLIEKVETQWEGLEYLVIGKVLERRLWQLEIFFFCQRSTFNLDKIKEFQKKKFFHLVTGSTYFRIFFEQCISQRYMQKMTGIGKLQFYQIWQFC